MELQSKIKEGNWYKQALNTKAYYIFTCCKAAMKCARGDLGIWAITNGNYLEAFVPKDQFQAMAQQYLEQQKEDPKHIDRYMKKCAKHSAALFNYYGTLSSISVMNLKEVRQALKKLDSLIYEYWKYSYYCDIYDPNGDELLAREMKRHSIHLSESELNIFMKSNWLNYMQEEQLSLHKVKTTGKGLLAHAKKFFYINNSWESTTVLAEKDFKERLADITDEEVKRIQTDWKAEQTRLQEKYQIPEELISIFYYFRQLFIMRDIRKHHTLLNNHYLDQLVKRFAKLNNLNFKELRVLLVEDLIGDANTIPQKVSQRRNLFLEVFHQYKSNVLASGKAVSIFNLLQKNYGVGGNLRGQAASKGKVTAIARVIFGETHFSKFNEGEIIVAPMTRPEYVPLMKKAAAIVTDEGGITCHAAIVSRELGIPCIVGTQKATSKLKDGMLIEVDANTGLIKIIKHMKLVTVQSLVDKELEKYPNIIDILQEGLLNITAAAEKFKPTISEQLGKDINVHAISMAIRRYAEKN